MAVDTVGYIKLFSEPNKHLLSLAVNLSHDGHLVAPFYLICS
jgi:hypothetical protein